MQPATHDPGWIVSNETMESFLIAIPVKGELLKEGVGAWIIAVELAFVMAQLSSVQGEKSSFYNLH